MSGCLPLNVLLSSAEFCVWIWNSEKSTSLVKLKTTLTSASGWFGFNGTPATSMDYCNTSSLRNTTYHHFLYIAKTYVHFNWPQIKIAPYPGEYMCVLHISFLVR